MLLLVFVSGVGDYWFFRILIFKILVFGDNLVFYFFGFYIGWVVRKNRFFK